MKIYEFRLTFHWSLFLGVQLTIFQHWFRWWLGADQATSHYLNQWWLDYRRIYASLGLNELNHVNKTQHLTQSKIYVNGDTIVLCLSIPELIISHSKQQQYQFDIKSISHNTFLVKQNLWLQRYQNGLNPKVNRNTINFHIKSTEIIFHPVIYW